MDDEDRIALGVFFSMIAALLIGGMVGFYSGIHAERKKSVEAGVGEWRVDPKTGETEFRYKR